MSKSRPSDTSGPLDESRQPKLWTTAKIIAVARRELNKIVVMRHNEARRTSEMKEFKELWIDTGIARWTRGVPRSNVFTTTGTKTIVARRMALCSALPLMALA